MWYVVIFVMQDTSQMQQLLCICMSTKISVKFQTIQPPTSSIRLNIIHLLIRKQNMSSLSVDTPGVLWVEGQG